tara:strand:+ start:7 stop:354 length:348 start_codon:yes stop_codon:yes gene_type:complete
MIDYTKQICEACRFDAPEVPNKEIESFLNQNLGWELSKDVNFKQLKKSFLFKDFILAQKFSNLIGELAESEGHHPSLLVEYGKVTVRWWSHKINSLHKNDLILSAKTDEIRAKFD